ncbi:hypothetical protein QVD17_07681 [Tagetes erecta]|uniref:Uncharacterized protein n=1 Tax=Tagetes erecta TaxID=13708 RepID=A0AAD8PCN3_TARER|nr:hypothetical protein QVD17_07681 [Tagetes erecta]
MFFLRRHFRSQLSYYSTSTSTKTKTYDGPSSSTINTQVANYLINTLQFTKDSAISSSSKVSSRLFTPQKSDSVLHLLKDNGFNTCQIKHIVTFVPKLLLCKPHKTLEPKIRVFINLGLSTSDVVSLIKRNPYLFELGLDSRIVPMISYLKMVVGSDEHVVDIINRSRWLFGSSALKMYTANVMLLQSYGFSNDQIKKYVLKNTRHFTQQTEWLAVKMNWVETKLGVSRDSSHFFRCFYSIASNSISNMEKKMEVYRRFGFSDTELSMLFKRLPYCFALSEDTIRDKLRFFVNELGYTPSYLVTCHTLFSLSLEKRVKPRNQVLKILKEKMLVSPNKSLITLVGYPELRFQDYLRQYEDQLPCLYETYVNSIR